MGLHPCDVSEENYKHEIAHVEAELETGKYIAVGEIGLDLHWDKSTLEIQKKAFIHQVKLAKKYKLPIAIHVRESFAEAIELIEKLNDENLRGVFHCFTGNIDDAQRVINLGGFYLGIGGVLTFKNSGLETTSNNFLLFFNSSFKLFELPIFILKSNDLRLVNICPSSTQNLST